ncbi:cystine ABC transporter substrate-binding protein [Actinomadura vinacea]|uniref:Cystine ABC transporter substrate-binding protein n=1 Tax=Actinomadura vinacea TaxID=115336 RepID=A0ABN3J578_9ACTN
MSRPRPLITTAVVLLLGSAAACGGAAVGGPRSGLAAAKERGTLLVANTQANPPWNFVDEQDRPAGYDVDVANEIARRLGIGKVKFVKSNYKSFIPGVQSGRYDIVISGQTITDERKKQVGFSRPYQVNGIAVFVAAGNTSIRSASDLRGHRIAVTAGTTQEQWVLANVPGAKVKTLQNATLSLTDVSLGREEAGLVSKFQGSYLAGKNNLKVKPVGPLLETEITGMSFGKSDTAMKTAVDEAIADMLADGTLSRISRTWLNGLDMAAELRKLPAQ